MNVSRLTAAGFAFLALSGGAEGQQQFNGRWSVLVVTERGE
jgi:hypothetical protein